MEARQKALDGDWAATPQIGANRTKASTVNAAWYRIIRRAPSETAWRKVRKKCDDQSSSDFERNTATKRIALLHKNALQTILNKKTPAAASNWRKALRGFIDHCLSLDMISVDPLAGVKLVRIKSDGHHPWEPEECRQFEARHVSRTGIGKPEIQFAKTARKQLKSRKVKT
jgi:hypothetical protein